MKNCQFIFNNGSYDVYPIYTHGFKFGKYGTQCNIGPGPCNLSFMSVPPPHYALSSTSYIKVTNLASQGHWQNNRAKSKTFSNLNV